MKSSLLQDSQKEDQKEALSDENVLHLATSNPAVFEVLVNRYQKPFLRKAHSILRSAEDSQDAVQEAFVKIYSAAPRFRKTKGASFKSWGYAILINTCISHYRKKKRRSASEIGFDPELVDIFKDEGYEKLQGQIRMHEEVMVMLSRIPEKLARTLRLHAIDGYSYKEVAEKEGVTLPVVKSRIHRAKEKLRHLFVV